MIMKRDFTIEVSADNNFSVLNRIINALNRRRVRIKRLLAHEFEDDYRRGGATLLLHTTPEMIEKVKQQLEKLIEVESANYYEASELEFENIIHKSLVNKITH
jgi:acetolactate synthase small subunit